MGNYTHFCVKKYMHPAAPTERPNPVSHHVLCGKLKCIYYNRPRQSLDQNNKHGTLNITICFSLFCQHRCPYRFFLKKIELCAHLYKSVKTSFIQETLNKEAGLSASNSARQFRDTIEKVHCSNNLPVKLFI